MNTYLKRTWAEINLDNLIFNYNNIKAFSNGKEIIAVVKANAYGHGDITISRELMQLGVRYFAVSNIWEAKRLRNADIKGDILIFSYTDLTDIKNDSNFIFTVGNVDYAKQLNELAWSLNRQIRVHIKIDSGMSRVGVSSKKELEEIMALEWLKCEGAYTHFAVADSKNTDDIEFTEKQQKRFLNIAGESGLHLHSQNSGGITLYSDFIGDFIRPGIILYGQKPSSNIELPIKIKPVLKLKSIISQIKIYNGGEFVSYGRKYEIKKKSKIAVIPVGYADGYPRFLTNKGVVLINGQTAPVVGTICMDLMMVNISHIDNAKVGDEVSLYSDESIKTSLDTIADEIGTISYELLCDIGMRVPRVFYKNNNIINVERYI